MACGRGPENRGARRCADRSRCRSRLELAARPARDGEVQAEYGCYGEEETEGGATLQHIHAERLAWTREAMQFVAGRFYPILRDETAKDGAPGEILRFWLRQNDERSFAGTISTGKTL